MGDGSIWSTVLLFVLMGGVLYFLMIRPQQKRQKEQQNAMSALEPGARVMLISGIVATIKYLGDKQAVVEISPGVEMTIDKRAISPQPVTDEFEYADEPSADAEPATAPATPAAATGEPGNTPAAVVEPAPEPAPATEAAAPVADALDSETGESTWDNPPNAEKN